MPKSLSLDPFVCSPDDPLADSHREVSDCIEQVSKKHSRSHRYYIDIRSYEECKELLKAKPAESREYLIAALHQHFYWAQEMQRLVNLPENQGLQDLKRILGWEERSLRRNVAEELVKVLIRKKLPFTNQDLVELVDWSTHTYNKPVGAVVKAVERYADEQPIDGDLCEALKRLVNSLRNTTSYEKDIRKYLPQVEELYAPQDGAASIWNPEATLPPPDPAPAGIEGVLVELKSSLGMLPGQALAEQNDEERVLFPYAEDSPFVEEHQFYRKVIAEILEGNERDYDIKLGRYPLGKEVHSWEPEKVGRFLLVSLECQIHLKGRTFYYGDDRSIWQTIYAIQGMPGSVAKIPYELSRDGLFDLLLAYSSLYERRQWISPESLNWISQVEEEAVKAPLTPGERFVLSRYRDTFVLGPPFGTPCDEVKTLTNLIGDGLNYCLVPGEVWTDAVNADFKAMKAESRLAWSKLFKHAHSATSARPTAKWLKTAKELIKALKPSQVSKHISRWLPLVAGGKSGPDAGLDTMQDDNATCLRGLLWMIQTLPKADEMARLISSVALTSYKKVPGVGPRAVKVGNAAVYALSEMGNTDAVGQLAMLKVRIKFGTAQKEIEKAFTKAAEALGLPRDEIEEMGVPSYGLEEIGKRSETFGDYRADLVIDGSDAQLQWFDAKGKQLKSVPAKVKKEFKEDLKDLQQGLKDIKGMLPAQRDRIDSLFLGQKTWPIEQWKERYLNHPLVGTIASRLLWCVDGTPALFMDGVPTDVQGKEIEHGKTAEITLWHPVGREVEEITAWRARLESLGITQPFKQAHREVYLLTDAERNTGTYSNRFAAHVIRQHQFNALCAARGWKNRLRLMVDDSYEPPTKTLPLWGMRAEYWVESIGEDYGTDTNDAGVFLRLVTDQVRFYRTDAAQNYAHASGGGYDTFAEGPGTNNINEPLPLEQVPPLVLSEIMRDVDLFVGVASVGNDPTWEDGGPGGRYRDYWHNYSFGELTGTAFTRKEVLERLVPRLKIAKQCSFSDRFLIVEGKKRTYKIHLGSGNILMEPNDQYLCIVPDAKVRAKKEDLFLPFEGDGTLSVIISKAFLLAEDTKIKDPTIISQIER